MENVIHAVSSGSHFGSIIALTGKVAFGSDLGSRLRADVIQAANSWRNVYDVSVAYR